MNYTLKIIYLTDYGATASEFVCSVSFEDSSSDDGSVVDSSEGSVAVLSEDESFSSDCEGYSSETGGVEGY